MCSKHDFMRRKNAAQLLSKLISKQGVSKKEFFDNNGSQRADDMKIESDNLTENDFRDFRTNIFLDIRDSSNAFAWILLRRVLRVYGSNYYERCQLFISYYLGLVMFYLVYVNWCYWTNHHHFGTGIVQMVLVALHVGTAFIGSLIQASALQDQVSDDRLQIKKEIVLMSREIITLRRISDGDANLIKDAKEYSERLEEAKDFLQASDGLIKYEEEEKDPTGEQLATHKDRSDLQFASSLHSSSIRSLISLFLLAVIAGIKADLGLVQTCITTFLSLAFIAYEGYSNSGCKYKADWSFFCDSDGGCE